MMTRFVLLFLLALSAALSPPRPAGAGDPVIVFAAASLKTALDEVVVAYTGHDAGAVVVSYAGSSALARQIEYGAPAEIFISANVAWMDLLEREGLIAAPTRVALLSNRLVLIAAPDNDVALRLGPGADLAKSLGDGRLAMAMIEAVPAGIYGRAALTSLGLWRRIAPLVAQTDNVRAALALVAMGEAPMGIVYATDALADPRVRVVDTFPASSHPPIVYPAALTTQAGRPAAAFMSYLTSPQAQAIFAANGFGQPGASQ